MVSRYRPAARIIAMTPIEEISRQLSIVWGIMPIVINEYNSSSEIQDVANAVLSREKILKDGEKYVITGGVPVGVPGTTNYLSFFKFV
jgi:pyruvate kinase